MTYRIEGDMFGGMWKFRADVTHDQLVQIAEDWKTSTADEPYYGYEEIYIRGWGQNQLAICFRYRRKLAGDMRRYIDHTSHLLRRRFGNGLVGWDISEPITMIE